MCSNYEKRKKRKPVTMVMTTKGVSDCFHLLKNVCFFALAEARQLEGIC